MSIRKIKRRTYKMAATQTVFFMGYKTLVRSL